MYKYHKRTKEGRTGKADGKTYRFFDQLEAFEHHPQIQSPTPPKTPTPTTSEERRGAKECGCTLSQYHGNIWV